MFGLGMRVPRKSRDKTRTLHACADVFCVIWCEYLMIGVYTMSCCVFGVLDMLYVLWLFVCLVIST